MKISNKKAFYINIFFVTGAITVPHSILTLILLEKGVTLSQIAFIQAMYSLAVIIFEFPSGILSDLISRKKVYLFSIIFLMLAFSIILFSSNPFLLGISWFLYGISSALDTGTLDSEILIELKNDDKDIMEFMKNSEQLKLISAIIGAGLGFYLFKTIGINIYYLSLFLFVVSFIWIYFTFSSNIYEKRGDVGVKRHLKELFLEIKEKPQLKYLIAGKGIFQIFVQIHFQFWQAIFLYKSISKDYFYLFYLTFQFITIFSYRVDIKKINIKRLISLYSISLLILFLLKIEINNILFLVLYFTTVFLMFIVNYIYNYWFNVIIDVDRISSLTSLMSTISRIFSFLTLAIIGIELRYLSTLNIFVINTIISLTVITLILLKLYLNYIKKS